MMGTVIIVFCLKRKSKRVLPAALDFNFSMMFLRRRPWPLVTDVFDMSSSKLTKGYFNRCRDAFFY